MKNKKWKKLIFAAALLAVLVISGISALFTDGDTMTNIFTVGKVDIELQEPNWTPDEATQKMLNITPEQEFAKDPQVRNIGVNDAYVFMEVVVPYANITTVDDAGGNKETADTPLFSYDVKAGWVQVGDAEKNTVLKTITRRYAYGTADAMTVLPKETTTSTLFDYIRFANVVEDQAQGELEKLEGLEKEVLINAYAIQTDNINDGKILLDGNNADGKVKPADVWKTIFNQSLVDFTPLEYIKSSGTQYIDTGVQGGNIKFSADIVFDSIGSGWNSVLSEELRNEPYNQAGPRIKDGKWVSCRITAGNVDASVGTKYNLKGSNEAGNTYLDVNGIRVDYNTQETFAPYTLTIFGNNRGTTVNQFSSMKLFGLTLSDLEGRLIRNFVPCELLQDLSESKCADASLPHTEGTVGLWDTVEGRFYTNKGTGNFSPGYYVLDDYVHDSANLILDGIWNSAEGVHSDTLTEWVDLSGNCQPTPLGTVNTVGTNCITSDGTLDGRMTVPDVDPINLTTFTLELIYKKAGNQGYNQAILGRNHTTSYYVNTSNNNLITWIGNQTKTVANGLNYADVHILQLTCVGTSATARVDGVKTIENYVVNATSTGDPLCLFGNANTEVCFKGSIMAVRIHDRILTDEELAHNYEVDKKRFEL